jgi:hypothetical protein
MAAMHIRCRRFDPSNDFEYETARLESQVRCTRKIHPKRLALPIR